MLSEIKQLFVGEVWNFTVFEENIID
jgi:hypothetical protein